MPKKVELPNLKDKLQVTHWEIIAQELPEQALEILNRFLAQIEAPDSISPKETEQAIETLRTLILLDGSEEKLRQQNIIYLLNLAIWNTYRKKIVAKFDKIKLKDDKEGIKKRKLINEQARIGVITNQICRLLAGHDITNPEHETMLYNLLITATKTELQQVS